MRNFMIPRSIQREDEAVTNFVLQLVAWKDKEIIICAKDEEQAERFWNKVKEKIRELNNHMENQKIVPVSRETLELIPGKGYELRPKSS